MAELGERAVEAEQAAEGERRLAIAEERARIARDLHDSAGHAINLIAVRSGAARLRHQADPGRSLAALAEIEEIARQTAAELDGIVHSLRDDSASDGTPASPAGLASLSTLVGHQSRSGLKVAVRSTGSPRPLGHTQDQAAYRILQEALTNAARHGRGEASVELAYEPAVLDITVTNDTGDGAGAGGRRGHGLIGMKERAALVGGSLEAGQMDGRFRVLARIPYQTGRECRGS
jgi:signal transduction histidine kinase